MTSYEAKRLLNFTEEPRFELATTMSENKMTVVTETTWKSSNPTNPANLPSAPISRANSDLSLYMPVRRRSVIQKPGVATRSNSGREAHSSARPNFRFSHPPTPSLSRQQSIESYRSGVLSMPPRIREPEVERVVTPSGNEYQSIGAFKLGSLRIVNGAASPASPEAEKSRNKGDKNRGSPVENADYFTGTQPGRLGVTHDARHPSAPSPRLQAPQPRAIPLSPINTSFLNLDTPSIRSGPTSGNLPPTLPAVPDYLAGITFSPFSLDKENNLPTSPQLQTTSKATALEDDLFEDEAQTEYSADVLQARRDASARLQGQSDGEVVRTVSRTDSGFASARSASARSASARSPSEYSHKPLTKADSGYSSNVSLRSFQTKAQERELTLSIEKQPIQTSRGAVSASEEERSLSLISQPAPPQREAPPPPVPPKDFPPVSPTQSRASTNTKKSASSVDATKPSAKTKSVPAPIISLPPRTNGPKSPESIPRTPGSAKSARSARSDRSTSALSIGNGPNKPSKLQRLLSSARRPAAGPLTVHTTHVEDKAGIPAIGRDVEHKFQEHAGLFPTTTRRLTLKPRPSLDTLKTIFSVGSLEASHEAANAVPSVPKVPESTAEEEGDPKESTWRHTLQAVPSTIVQAAAHVIPRKPIARKPVPDRQDSLKGKTPEPPPKSGSPDSVPMSEAELSTYSSVSNSLGNNAYDVALIAMASGGDVPLSPQIVSRTLSLPESAMHHLDMRSPALTNSPLDLPSPALPSPLLARNLIAESKAKSSPPVSMANRRPMPLRVPPPLRSQSSTASLNRKNSRESIQSYPSGQPLARKASRDSIHSYPSYQPGADSASERSDPSPPIPPMDPRRILSFRQSQSSSYRVQSWDVQTEHDYSGQSSRANSMHGHSRNNSVSSAPGFHDGYGIQRPGSAQSWQVRTSGPPLRHRSSYDGFNLQQRRVQYGHAPTMSNGYTAPIKTAYDPWNSNSQFDPGAGLGLQDSRYPPYVPRGHHRNRSLNRAAGPNAPYRVLHSYNSPAYRNAPIWG